MSTQHGRDQLHEDWPELYSVQQGFDLPAEEVVELKEGADYGWPHCYFDDAQQKLVLAPEYGGDGGKKVGVCAEKHPPVAAFPAHWAPNDIKIYKGATVPESLSGRRLHRLPRVVEPRAGTAGRILRRFPADGGRQGIRQVHRIR